MKKVVDANFLRDPALSVYIEGDPGNQVVFTDYACMECYKGNAIENIRRSLDIVSKYPGQVIVLKGTRDIIRLQSSGHPTLDDVVDMTYVAYATIFDGILSKDRKLLEIYEEANFILHNVFV